jgi:hypothetical protein
VPTPCDDSPDALLSRLPRRARKVATEQLMAGEVPQFVILGEHGQAILGLPERALVMKPGFMAGVSVGARATSFHYRDLGAVETNTGLVAAILELVIVGHAATRQKDYWSTDRHRDPVQVSHCLPMTKRSIRAQRAAIEQLRAKVQRATSSGRRARPGGCPGRLPA